MWDNSQGRGGIGIQSTFRSVAVMLIVAALASPLAITVDARSAEAVDIVIGFHEMPPDARVGGDYEGAQITHLDATLRFVVVAPEDKADLMARAQADERVRYIEPDVRAEALFTPNDPYFSTSQYGPQRIGAEAAWETTLGVASTQLCVIDSGVRRSHDDIANERYVGGIDLVADDGEPNDQNGHGTFVTAIATARTNNAKGIAGIASVSWRHARILDAGGSGSFADLATAIRWCADNGAHIITMSLGASSGTTAAADAVIYAWGKGAALVSATGNSGCTPCVFYPAAYPHVIATGCTTSSNSRCSISNGGPEIDIAAPGQSIISAYATSNSAYATGTGTSASAPHVAGALALLKSYAPGLTNVKMRERLETRAEDLGSAGWDSTYGHGLVRADALLFNAVPTAAMDCSPDSAAVGRTLTCLMSIQDEEGHPVRADIVWGDGQSDVSDWHASGAPSTLTHRYATTGVYTITAVAYDQVDPSATVIVTTDVSIVANGAPTAPVVECSPAVSAVGRDITCSILSEDDSDGVAYELEWGDGLVERAPVSGYAAPGQAVTAIHAYAGEGTYVLRARAVDDGPDALASAWVTLIREVRVCDIARAGRLTLGAGGAEVDGLTSTRVEGIEPGCAGMTFLLRGTGALADVDICWYQGNTRLFCDQTGGDETGPVPAGVDAASIVLFSGAQADWTLTIPASASPPPVNVRIIRTDDTEMDATLDLDFTDDRARKSLAFTLADAAALPSRAYLHITAMSYDCTSNSAVATLRVNDVPLSLFSPCALFEHGVFGESIVEIPIERLVPGAKNTFEIAKLSTSDWQANSVYFGRDTDTDVGDSIMTQNGKDLPGELMWWLELRL